jgi:predicted aspartyl protease
MVNQLRLPKEDRDATGLCGIAAQPTWGQRKDSMKLQLGCSLTAALMVSLTHGLISPCTVSADAHKVTLAQANPAQAAGAAVPSVEDLIASCVTAYGGKDALARIAQNSAFYGEQKTAGVGTLSSYKLAVKADKWRLDKNDNSAVSDNSQSSDSLSSRVTCAFDGRRIWQIKGKEPAPLLPSETQSLKDMVWRLPLILLHWQEPGYRFSGARATAFRQTPAYALDIQAPSDSVKTTVFIDQQNFLIVAITASAPKTGATAGSDTYPSIATTEFSQYRPVSGTLWPFKQIFQKDDETTSELNLKSVDTATEIADSSFVLPSAGAISHLSKEIVVPFDYSQREIVVKGRLNSASDELEFLVDTGASDTLIDRRVAAENFLSKDGAFSIAAMSGTVSADSSTLKRLELGKLIVNDVAVRILDLSGQSKHLGRPVAGIIGMNVLSRYLVTFDYSKPSLTFADAEDGARPAARPVTFVKSDAPFISASLSGNNVTEQCSFLVDTGAAFNHLPEAIAKKYVTGDTNNRHFIEGTGLDGQPVRLGTVSLEKIVLGGFMAKKVSLTYPVKADSAIAPAHSAPGPQNQKQSFFQDSNCGILGNPFWQNFIVTIDSKYQRLYLRNNPGFNAKDAVQKCLMAGDAALTLHRDYRDAELNYQNALMVAERANDQKERARLLGRLGNLRRLMAKDLKRPEHAKASYDYFSKAEDIAQKSKWSDVEGRILADWSLLYADNGQQQEARTTMERGLSLAADDPNVNVDVAVHLYRAGQFPEMQKYVEKALFLDPDNWQALWYQVKLSENFNDTPRVVSTLKDIVRYYPWSKVAKDKLAALANPASAGVSATASGGGASGASAAGAASGTTGGQPTKAPSAGQQAKQPASPAPAGAAGQSTRSIFAPVKNNR